MSSLPIQAFRDRILRALSENGALILTAPTGSGKSTQTPQFLLSDRKRFPGKVLVLQPRRLAARGLAGRVATETRTALGGLVGYRVRFEGRCGKDTAVVFETYGVFLQRLLEDPWLTGVGAVVLDEFHERTLESDLALAWLKSLRGRRPDLKLAVMSATLDAAALAAYLPGAAAVDVPGRLFPVEVRHQTPEAREDLPRQALRALRALLTGGLKGSVLVFMPGMREILRTASALGPLCREQGLELLTLHGSMELSEQQKVLDPESAGGRVIISTNVAETSLTIPGVAAVIDSGLHRMAGYSAARGINTLYLSRISRGSAAQRAGRAGRTGPGVCVRLWSHAEESSMPEAVPPEILRLELGALLLRAAALPAPLNWLSPPPEPARQAAERLLEDLGAASGGKITPRGRELLRYPVSPRLAAVLLDSRRLGAEGLSRACAMAAVLESPMSRLRGQAADLSELAEGLRRGGGDELPWEAGEIFRQLERIAGEPESGGPGDEAAVWLSAYAQRLAARLGQGQSYLLADGRRVLLPVEKGRRPPPLILALEVEETAGAGQARQVSAPMYLPLDAEAVTRAHPKDCAWRTGLDFDEEQRRVVKTEKLLFRGLAIVTKPVNMTPGDRKAAAAVWAERLAKGDLRHPGLEKAGQLLARIALARRLYPELGLPAMDQDDWLLVYEEACAGKNSWPDIEKAELESHVGRYVGAQLMAFLDKSLPARRRLPNGRTGKFFYSESQPPELSARLEDLWGMKGALALCEGRLPVTFDILSPAFRTVQKTQDLGSFWTSAYPRIKKELQRKYPKHLWP